MRTGPLSTIKSAAGKWTSYRHLLMSSLPVIPWFTTRPEKLPYPVLMGPVMSAVSIIRSFTKTCVVISFAKIVGGLISLKNSKLLILNPFHHASIPSAESRPHHSFWKKRAKTIFSLKGYTCVLFAEVTQSETHQWRCAKVEKSSVVTDVSR